MTSCKQYSAEYKQAVAENDSLRLELTKSESEMNDMLSILNSIEDDILAIRKAEDFINIEKDAELSGSRIQRIKENMNIIVATLKKNKAQLAELQNKINKGSAVAATLQKTVDRLTKELSEQNKLVVSLQNDLNRKDEEIKGLSAQVENLNTDIKILEGVREAQSERLTEQEQTLNTVYYCFGTKKELKEHNILSGGSLFSKSKTLEGDFDRKYFVGIDKRKDTSIPLFSSHAAIKTKHSKDTYSFSKDKEGNLTLVIGDPEKFWGLSKYLVIEVD
jgi:archaellum component FlaC